MEFDPATDALVSEHDLTAITTARLREILDRPEEVPLPVGTFSE